MSQVAVEYFQNFIARPPILETCDIHNFDNKTNTDLQSLLLEATVTQDLIYKTLKTMKMNNAPGPDGFTVEIILDAWEVVDQDFCRAMVHFFESPNMHPGINATSIALIPTVNTPTNMGDFKPISLSSVAYKCIAKIISNHLKMVLPML